MRGRPFSAMRESARDLCAAKGPGKDEPVFRSKVIGILIVSAPERGNFSRSQAYSEVPQSPVECFARGKPPARRGIGARGSPGGAVPMVSFADRAATPTHVLVRILDRESVLLNLETEQYFGLDETGTRMWQLVTGSPNIDAAYRELLAEFDVEPELLRSNLLELLSRLVDSGLLQVLPADVGTAPAI